MGVWREVREKTRLLGRARPRRSAMLQEAGRHHRRVLSGALVYVGRHVESSWGERLEAESGEKVVGGIQVLG